MAMINPNIGTGSFLKGVTPKNGGQRLPEVSQQIADEAKVTMSVVDSSTTTQMAQDLGKLQKALSGKQLSEGQTKVALMAAGALTAGPAGLVVTDLAGNLHTAMSTPDGIERLANQAAENAKARGIQGMQLETLGNRVDRAVRSGEDAVETKNAPVALFMGGALKHAEASQQRLDEQSLGRAGRTGQVGETQFYTSLDEFHL